MKGPAWLASDLRRVEKLMMETVGDSMHPLVSDASLHLLKAGGKRMRPTLVVITSRSGPGDGAATHLGAAAIELVHLATLYHDDVIDGTGTRRGVPTAHSKWGTEIAVLAGDYLFALGCALGAEAGGRVPLILARALAEVCEGQIAETAALGSPERSVADYVDTIRLKTAALFKAACELGDTTSGADGAAAALEYYGECLGLAFQVVDDVLDLVGDAEVTGKVPGTDLKEGVFTAPVLIAGERDPALPEALARGERELETVMPYLLATGALEDAVALAGSFAGSARGALEPLGSGAWREALEELVDGVMDQVDGLVSH